MSGHAILNKPPTFDTTNPYRAAYDALWALLEAKHDFLLLFAGSGEVKLDSARYFAPNPDVENPAPADFPMLRIAVVALDVASERDSSSSEDEMTLELQISTGSQQQGLLLDCVWPIRRALVDWRQYVRSTVTWNGSPCIVDVDSKPCKIEAAHVEGGEKGDMPDVSRGYEQWAAIWNTTIKFYFQTSALKGI